MQNKALYLTCDLSKNDNLAFIQEIEDPSMGSLFIQAKDDKGNLHDSYFVHSIVGDNEVDLEMVIDHPTMIGVISTKDFSISFDIVQVKETYCGSQEGLSNTFKMYSVEGNPKQLEKLCLKGITFYGESLHGE